MNKQAKCQKTFLWLPNRMNRTLCNFVSAEKRRNSRNPSEKHVLGRKFKRSWLGIEKIIFWAPARSVISLFEAFRKGGRWDGGTVQRVVSRKKPRGVRVSKKKSLLIILIKLKTLKSRRLLHGLIKQRQIELSCDIWTGQYNLFHLIVNI